MAINQNFGTNFGPGSRVPLAPTPPTFVPAQVDTNRINFLTQQAAAPGLRGLQTGLSESLNQRFNNPNVQALVARNALKGFGTGVSNVIGQASRTGLNQFGQEFASQNQSDLLNFNAKVNQQNKDYQNKLGQFLLAQSLRNSRTNSGNDLQAGYNAAQQRLNAFGQNQHTGTFDANNGSTKSFNVSSYPQLNQSQADPNAGLTIGRSQFFDNSAGYFRDTNTGQLIDPKTNQPFMVDPNTGQQILNQ